MDNSTGIIFLIISASSSGPALFGLPSSISPFLPPFIGSLFGVILGFTVNYKYQSYEANKNKIKYINMIGSEIELCIATLNLEIVQLLPATGWTATLNSGASKLFEVDTELQPLSIGYYKISNYNNMATRYMGYPWERLYREDGHRLPLYQV